LRETFSIASSVAFRFRALRAFADRFQHFHAVIPPADEDFRSSRDDRLALFPIQSTFLWLVAKPASVFRVSASSLSSYQPSPMFRAEFLIPKNDFGFHQLHKITAVTGRACIQIAFLLPLTLKTRFQLNL
jgi:hypothetical protein